MKYKIYVSTELDHHECYCERYEEALMIYKMAIETGWFDYVCLCEAKEDTRCVEEWSGDNDG